MDVNQSLYNAIEQDDWAGASRLINIKGALPDDEMLDLAIKERDDAWVEKLLDAGAKPTQDNIGVAIENGSMTKAKLLLDAYVGNIGWKLRRFAKKQGPQWAELLDQPPSINDSSLDQYLYNLVLKGDLEQIKTLTDVGTVPNGKTLRLALNHMGTEEIKETLLTTGTPPPEDILEYAVKNLPADRVELLIEAGAKPNEDMLQTAIFDNDARDWPTVQAIMKAGVKPDSEMLDFAVDELPAEWVEGLINGGAQATPAMLSRAVCGDGTQDWDTANVLIKSGKVVPDTPTLDYAVNVLEANWVALLVEEGHAKPTSQMLYNAVCVEGVQDWPTAEVLVRNGAVPDADTMAYINNHRDELDSRWTELLDRAAAGPQSPSKDGYSEAFTKAGQNRMNPPQDAKTAALQPRRTNKQPPPGYPGRRK